MPNFKSLAAIILRLWLRNQKLKPFRMPAILFFTFYESFTPRKAAHLSTIYKVLSLSPFKTLTEMALPPLKLKLLLLTTGYENVRQHNVHITFRKYQTVQLLGGGAQRHTLSQHSDPKCQGKPKGTRQ
jgi:hypothetical protein